MQETSSEALDSLKNKIPSIEERVYNFIESRRRVGAICDEIEKCLSLKHQTASARITSLRKKGLIIDGGERRMTRSRRDAIVWVAVEKKPAEQRSLFDE